ncbi:MAG: glycosyl transferase [Bacteroidetes bacterium]|nr:glycosyl transferase [Bacteroidota bacterium]
MKVGLVISPADLAPYGPVGTLAEQAAALLRQQKGTWELLRKGYEGLSGVRTRRIMIGALPFDVQFNPGRIVSSSANVDPETIRQRRCFLCHEHLPPPQRGLAFGEFLILCNPFPIFPAHFTIPHRSHVAQRIDGAFSVLLDLCRQLGGAYELLYNGPRCGASAPDHLHFQAGSSGFMPLPQALMEGPGGTATRVMEGAGVEVAAVDDGLRRWFQIDGEDLSLIEEVFDVLLGALSRDEDQGEEPMINIVAYFRRRWTVLVFPRKAHRPSFYGKEGGMIVSPAAVDMGGVTITPREEDFLRIAESDARRLFEDVCVGPGDFARAASELRRQLS